MGSESGNTERTVRAHGVVWESPDGRRILDGLDFVLPPGRSGLVGRNGAGKTTLLRLIAGRLAPTQGQVDVVGRVAWLPQARVDDGALEVVAMLGVAGPWAALRAIEAGSADPGLFETLGERWDLASRIERVLERVGLGHIAPTRPASTLSGGEATRVLLAGALLTEPDWLLLDEPTNHLDEPSREALYEVMRGWTRGLVAVSHDRGLLRCMDDILELSSSGLARYGGNWDDYVAQRAVEEEAARRQLEHAEQSLKQARAEARKVQQRQQRKAARGRRQWGDGSQPKEVLSAWREQSQKTGGRVAAQGARSVESARERLSEARERVEVREPLRLDLGETSVPSRRTVLTLSDVSWSFAPGRPLLEGVTLRVMGPERIALIGPNGSGKTTLIRLLTGELAADEGEVTLGVERVRYLDQRCAMLDPSASVLENLRAHAPRLEESRARWVLDQFLFPEDVVTKSVGVLSGGERVRAALACLLAGDEPPQLLILDEPTNDVDLDSIEQITRALQAYDGALLVASHDADFRAEIALERCWRLPGDGRVIDEV